MFEIGSEVAYQKDKKVTGVVKGIHEPNRPDHRIVCVKLDNRGGITWFTPVELATEDDINEYKEWLLSKGPVPYLHEWAYDVLECNDPIPDKEYAMSINYGLTLYLGLQKEKS